MRVADYLELVAASTYDDGERVRVTFYAGEEDRWFEGP